MILMLSLGLAFLFSFPVSSFSFFLLLCLLIFSDRFCVNKVNKIKIRPLVRYSALKIINKIQPPMDVLSLYSWLVQHSITLCALIQLPVTLRIVSGSLLCHESFSPRFDDSEK